MDKRRTDLLKELVKKGLCEAPGCMFVCLEIPDRVPPCVTRFCVYHVESIPEKAAYAGTRFLQPQCRHMFEADRFIIRNADLINRDPVENNESTVREAIRDEQ